MFFGCGLWKISRESPGKREYLFPKIVEVQVTGTSIGTPDSMGGGGGGGGIMTRLQDID